MASILREVNNHASVNTKYHCLYAHYFLGLKKSKLAVIYKKDETTIREWIRQYETEGSVNRKQREVVYLKFSSEKRAWLVELYKKRPILHLKEATELFFENFKETISASTISLILHEAGFSWKVIERRAIQIQLADINRYTDEISQFPWFVESLCFIDEVSFDNRAMIRKNGYAIRGERLIYRGEFCRKPRESLLCFLGANGIANCYQTEGTFNRKKFAAFCRKFALDHDSNVLKYPGQLSVWIMDGAKIHCDENLISYLRSLGIIPLFLPAYCPFFNPIEVVFGLMKRELKQIYKENSKMDLSAVITQAVNKFTTKNMRPLFQKCGYILNGHFDPLVGFKQDTENMGFVE